MSSSGPTAVRALILALVLLATALGSAPAAAQQPTRADSAAVLLDAARQLDAAGRGEAADALFDLILERYGDTPAAEQVRARRVQPGQARMSRAGNTELVVWSALYGLWLGVAIPAAADADGPKAYGAGLLLGGPAGFLAGRAYARSRPVTPGHARAITFGGTWGTWQGFGWAEGLDWGAQQQACVPPDFCEVDVDSETRARFVSAIVGGLAGIGIGAWVADTHDISRGTATMVDFGALWGTWYGWSLAEIGGVQQEIEAALIGGNAGLLAMALLAPRWNLSHSRARLINIAGVVGLLGGIGIDLLVQPDNDDVALAIPVLTSAAGLAFGALATRDRGVGGDGGGGGRGGALLERHGGDWDLGLPATTPLLVAGPDGQRRASLRVPLLRASF
ncbi:MAG: tetratricopeptide repeat protein [Longimicrobiales bacterium]